MTTTLSAAPGVRSLELAAPVVLELDSDPVSAVGALEELRRRHPEITAVAAVDDEVALRVLAAMSDLGLQAPGDLAVIGFDDNRYGALWRPALTTVHIEAEAFGRRSARAALGLDVGEWETTPSHVIPRDSA